MFEMAAQSGIWSVLFVSLFFYQIKDSKTREEKYQKTIKTLADSLSVVNDIKEDVQNIKDIISK